MIVKMKKYAFLVYHKEYDSFLDSLRSLGVVHVKQSKSTKENRLIQQLLAEDKRVQAQLKYLKSLLEEEKRKPDGKGRNVNEGTLPATGGGSAEGFPLPAGTEAVSRKILPGKENEVLLREIEEMREKSGRIQSTLLMLEKERDAMSVWGDFSYDGIGRLRDNGYAVTFFTCPPSNYDESWENDYNAVVINTTRSTVYFITITPVGSTLSINADRAKMAPNDYRHICEAIKQENSEKAKLEAGLLNIAHAYYDSLEAFRTDIENESEWNHVLEQTEHEAGDKVMLLEGWIPRDKTAGMEKALAGAGYYYRETAITDDDNIPVKLKNNRLTGFFEPITKLYSLPNYSEFDPTPLFAPFFMLFFGLCLCDGGYGLLLFLAATCFKRKAGGSLKPILSLLQCFGVATFAVGMVTGSFFGVSLVEISSFSSLKKYLVSSDSLMLISIVIGFFHVIFAKFVAAYKIKVQRGLKYSLSAFAWIFLILAFACILVLPMAKIRLSQTVEYILYGIAGLSALVAFLYNTPGKNVFLNFGSGLWAAYNNVSGLVGDVLSYIRLYAIGLTGGLLGGVFNTIAIDMTASISPFIRWLPMLLILLAGHALNIALSMISSFVHPLRLVYVEYYKNSEFEGGGMDYKPFKKI
jgi:V/A-type H+-transporting ATPase subunit I